MTVGVSWGDELYIAYTRVFLHALHAGRANMLHVAVPPYTAHSIQHCVRQLWCQVTMSAFFLFQMLASCKHPSFPYFVC